MDSTVGCKNLLKPYKGGDETLYVLSDTEVTVLSEKTWEKVNSLKVKATEPVRRKEDAGKNPPLLN